ncbi:MAG: GatB/YqeY domain-containing protein [Bacteroidales bacterium]|nr:GatB/YqeY domain-containing protein [Bacteroidales bacterium]MDD5975257.1 GatB/YqeY domain-containing protein [Bacteroidales bacterium]MDY5193415.1 GatB/YqeY domain-containing protein [Candidatus Aphodosoma sp.]
MNLFDQISEDIKKAMLARNKAELEALRGIKKELLEAKTSKEANGEVTDELAIKIIQKMAKQGKDAAQVFISQNRQDLADEYLNQVAVYEKYLPKMMSADELASAVKEIIANVGATSPKDMGKVMGVATKQLAGKADGRAISEMVKNILASL